MYRWLDDLDDALIAGGVPFIEVPFSYSDPTGADGWWDRGRPASTGSFDVSGVLCHHTASPIGTTADTDLRVILSGNGDAPGPISSFLVDRGGVVYLIAAGRCNHGGKGRRPGIDVGGCADMNAHLIGIEVSNNGIGEWWPDVQTTAYARLVAALVEWYRWPTSSVFLHATTGPPYGGCNSKIDPAGPWQLQPDLVGSTTWDLDLWRGHVDTHRGTAPEPTPPTPLGDPDMAFIHHGTYTTFMTGGGFATWVPTPADADALGAPPPDANGSRGAYVSPDLLKGLILVGTMPPDFNAGWFAAWWPDGTPPR